MSIYNLAAYLLIVLGLIMMFLAYRIQGLPPAVTGLGFWVIAAVFFQIHRRNSDR